MAAYVLVYDGFAQFEVIFTCLFLKEKKDIVITGIDGNDIKSLEGFCIKPTVQLKDVNVDDIDLLIIPGGEAKNIYDSALLDEVLRELNKRGKLIAAICAAPVKLAMAGVLEGRNFTVDRPELEEYKECFKGSSYIDKNVVIDENIITAKPCGYMDFALETAKSMGVYENELQLQETIDFFKFGLC